MYWKIAEDPTWRPYCLKCRTMTRMVPVEGGFKCGACGITVDQDMHLVAPPSRAARIEDTSRVYDHLDPDVVAAALGAVAAPPAPPGVLMLDGPRLKTPLDRHYEDALRIIAGLRAELDALRQPPAPAAPPPDPFDAARAAIALAETPSAYSPTWADVLERQLRASERHGEAIVRPEFSLNQVRSLITALRAAAPAPDAGETPR